MARRWKVLLVCSLAVFMSFLDVTIVNIAFPDVERSFRGSSLASLSWILNAFNIVFASLLVPAGRIADRLGRKRLFLFGIVLFVAASAACAAAPTVPLLVASRVVQAVGAAILVPTSLALLLPEFPLEQRATATAIWGATGAVAAATGPSLGGLLVHGLGWRWVFLVNLPIGLAALAPARRTLRESRSDGTAAPDLVGVVLLIAGVAALALGLVKTPEWGWGSARFDLSVGAGLALLAAFVVRSARHAAPVVDLALFRVRSFTTASTGTFMFAMGFYAMLLCNVLFLTGVWHYSILKAGLALTPGPLTAAITAPIGGRLSDRFGQRVVAIPGTLLFAAGTLLFALLATSHGHWLTDFLPANIVTGAGVGLSFAAFGSAAVAELPPARFATGSAVAACFRQIGAVLGISVMLAIVGTHGGIGSFHEAWRLMSLAALGATAAGIAMGRVRARVPELATPEPAVALAVTR